MFEIGWTAAFYKDGSNAIFFTMVGIANRWRK